MNKTVLRRSERIYGFILNFYPKSYRQEFGEEMKYVFAESLKEAYAANGGLGIFTLWTRTIIDAGKSLFTQHMENRKGGETMKTKSKDIIMQNKVFGWIALGTGAILLIPLIANWPWTMSDFVIMGILIFGTSLTFIVLARKVRKHRTIIAVALFIAFLLMWAELAVGIFGTPFAGS